MNWKFQENSILNSYNERTACKEIFQATCDEIGKYYETKGWKYTRSRPKISFKNEQIKIEISFWSSGSNIPGSYVNLEILPTIYSLELINNSKEKGMKSKGYILSFIELFTERLNNKPEGSKVIINAFGDIIERIDEHSLTPELKYNKNVNVYGITETNFVKIIEYIESRIIVWIERINDINEIDVFLNKLTNETKIELLNRGFGEFLRLKHPEYLNKH